MAIFIKFDHSCVLGLRLYWTNFITNSNLVTIIWFNSVCRAFSVSAIYSSLHCSSITRYLMDMQVQRRIQRSIGGRGWGLGEVRRGGIFPNLFFFGGGGLPQISKFTSLFSKLMFISILFIHSKLCKWYKRDIIYITFLHIYTNSLNEQS